MDSPNSEAPVQETTPLLASTRSERDSAEEADVTERPTTSTVQHLLSIGFPICIALGVAIEAFLLAANLLVQYGDTKFQHRDYRLEIFTPPVFAIGLASIALGAVNMIRFKHAQKYLHAFINAVFLFIFAYNLISSVDDLNGSTPQYCREHRDDYPSYSPAAHFDLEGRQHGDLVRTSYRGSQEECQKWAPKMQAVRLILIYLVGIHGIILSSLFLAVLVDIIRIVQHHFKHGFGTNTPKFLLSPGNISFEVSLRWGSPPRKDAAQNQVERVVAPEQESESA
ncbi:hypothetical protein AK830_g974 [Neonectria ditissima]|uniref:Uncharacterized protein n=1 Tax=Neonectria ditissima TaxID=78410 RepID=A0A0P7B6S6_9HYPO|nr:hypothetical protein AK830_g974 [Neonectria ditissima]